MTKTQPPGGTSLAARFGWFAVFYVCGVLAVGGVALLIRLALAH